MRRFHYPTSIHPLVDRWLEQHLKEGMRAIDATLGNGNDAFKIAQKIGESGVLYGFDIQEEALKNSQKRLDEIPKEMRPQLALYQMSHANFKEKISELVDLIIYNLGYLPRGDKSITTVAPETLKSIEAGLELLSPNGLMLISIYHGHEAGRAEKEAVTEYLSHLDQRKFTVKREQFINQKNNPPFLYIIERSLE